MDKIFRLLLVFGLAFVSVAVHPETTLSDLYRGGEYDRLNAEMQVSGSNQPPVGGSWLPVRLPHLWQRDGVEERSVWYRLPLPDAPYANQYGIYIWRHSMNASVWLNEQFLGDGGQFSEPVSRNWNRPFLYVLPSIGWQPKQNFLYIRVVGYPHWGNLAPVVIGPFDELRRDYRTRYFWQVTLSQATFYVSLITALVALVLWLADRKSTLYAYFGLSCLAWCFYSLNLFLQVPPVGAKTWWAMVHSSVDWYSVCLALFAHRLAGVERLTLDRILVGFGLFASLVLFAVDLQGLSKINNYFHAVSLGIAGYLFLFSLWFSIRKRAVHMMAFTGCMFVIVGFGAHDLGMNTMVTVSLWQNQFFWLQFSAPILMLTMLSVLAYRFVGSIREQVNAEQRIRIERERMFTDIHDDVGSKVLSLVYSADNENQANLARDALREIRAIVSGGTSRGGEIGHLLPVYQAEARQRCVEAGMTLDWTENLGDSTIVLSDSFQYHFQRILREMVTNAIKHAGGSQLDIFFQNDTNSLRLSVRDHGAGIQQAQPGTGMSGIARRAKELGGTAEWLPAEPGCRVNVELPLDQGATL